MAKPIAKLFFETFFEKAYENFLTMGQDENNYLQREDPTSRNRKATENL